MSNPFRVKVEKSEPDFFFSPLGSPHVSSATAHANPFLCPTPTEVTRLTKPRDIPILELKHLEGLDAAARLQIFFELVERCSPNDQTRIQIAKERVSTELAVLIHSKQSTLHTWNDFQFFLRTEFAVDVNVDRAWQELENLTYDCEETPQSFTNKFICQHASLVTRFPNERFPDRDKTIKRKLWNGMPRTSRFRLEGFLEEGYPLPKFIDRLEHERLTLLASSSPGVYRIPKKTGEDSETPPPSPSPEPVAKGEVEELRRELRQLKLLMTQLKEEPVPPRNHWGDKYCQWCRTRSHNLQECWSKPNTKFCFDCRQSNLQRGHPDCPGHSYPKPSTTRLTTPNTPPPNQL